MSSMEQWKVLLVFSPIIALFVLGFWVTLRSGTMQVGRIQGVRVMVANISQAALLMVFCLFALAAVQQLVGFRLALMW